MRWTQSTFFTTKESSTASNSRVSPKGKHIAKKWDSTQLGGPKSLYTTVTASTQLTSPLSIATVSSKRVMGKLLKSRRSSCCSAMDLREFPRVKSSAILRTLVPTELRSMNRLSAMIITLSKAREFVMPRRDSTIGSHQSSDNAIKLLGMYLTKLSATSSILFNLKLMTDMFAIRN